MDWIPLDHGRLIPNVSCLYVIKHRESGKQYVGKTLDLRRRAASHRSPAKGVASLISRAIVKYGPAAFDIAVYLTSKVDEELLALEPLLILELGTRYPLGYNLTEGGEGQKGYSPSAETRAKIGAATSRIHTGLKRSAETCAAIGDSKRGKPLGPHREETKEKLRQLHLGKSNPRKDVKGTGNAMYGKTGSAAPSAKAVGVWKQGSMLPEIYGSVKEAAAALHTTSASVCDWCAERHKPPAGIAVARL